MPNHVTNIITGAPEVIHALVKDDAVDFRLIIPEPANIERGNCSGQHEPGVVCWYEWNTRNWGTKWNGYDTQITALRGDQAELRFDTAWAHPVPVIEALSAKFPDYELQVRFADEDLGQNLGEYTIKAGRMMTMKVIEEGTDEARDFAAQIKYGQTYAELRAEWGE